MPTTDYFRSIEWSLIKYLTASQRHIQYRYFIQRAIFHHLFLLYLHFSNDIKSVFVIHIGLQVNGELEEEKR